MSRRRPTTTTHPRTPRGFTLVELLVVIGIIVVLIGILVPLVGNVRKQAHAVDTKAGISSLQAAFQAYYGDFNSYPGPVPNVQLRVVGVPPGCNITGAKDQTGTTITGWSAADMSMAENAYLGLLGGLEAIPGSSPTAFQVNFKNVGTGARSLGMAAKKFPAYLDNANVTRDGRGFGKFQDETGPANDTVIPEFLDRFPDPLPLLILRARPNAPGVVSESNVATATVPAQQYDAQQVLSYTASDIGVGKDVSKSDYKNGPAYPKHGLQSPVNPDAKIGPAPTPNPLTLVEVYPYDLYAALIDPTVTRVKATAAAPANSPRQKDGYIIISAGIDRTYGTSDDLTSFGSY